MHRATAAAYHSMQPPPRTVPLHSYVYISAVRDGLAEAEVDAILASAHRNNGDRGLTGVLLQYAGHFVQALEGPWVPLQEIVERIAADPRHHDVAVLEQGPIATRRFGDWAMRRIAVGPGEEPAVDAFFRRLVAQRGAADTGHLVQLLQALARRR